jgi:ATP-binding cassette subfamily B protein
MPVRGKISKVRLIRWIEPYVQPYRGRLAGLAVLSCASIGLGALAPWPIKIVVDNVLSGHPLPPGLAPIAAQLGGRTTTGLLAVVLIAGVLIQVAREAIDIAHTQAETALGERMTFDVRGRLFDHLQALSLRHHARVSAGDAVYRVSNDAQFASGLVLSALLPLATAVVTLAVMLAILWRVDRTLAVIALGAVPVLMFLVRGALKPFGVRAERLKQKESALAARIYERFAAIRIVKGFVRERHESARFRETAADAMQERLALTWQESMFSTAISLVTIAGTMAVLWVGGLHVLRGELTIGTLLVVLFYLGAVYAPLSAIARTAGTMQESLASAKRVRDAVTLTPEFVDEGVRGAGLSRVTRGRVSLEGVSFGYDGHGRVLDDVSFEAAPGELVAIVGPTGAGKSTALSLIPRFHVAAGGRVTIDDADVRDFDLRALREHIAIVPQDPVLFRGTIADNIRYGRLDASDGEVSQAAVAADADGFITALPDGYRTQIGDAGEGLSGGERQQISVARALLKDAPILLLDEPTSSLDAASEARLFDALARLRRGRTTIVVAHRLSTIRDADRIVVLDRGRAIATGRHDEVLATSDVYRRLWERFCAS